MSSAPRGRGRPSIQCGLMVDGANSQIMPSDPQAASLVGCRLGVYQVVTPLGAGGMGEVYRARDTRLGRDVALKVLPREFTADPDRLARFEREAGRSPRSTIRILPRFTESRTSSSQPSRDCRAPCARWRWSSSKATRWRSESSSPQSAGARVVYQPTTRWRSRGRSPTHWTSPRKGHRPPRSQTLEHHDHARRCGESARLRTRQADARG